MEILSKDGSESYSWIAILSYHNKRITNDFFRKSVSKPAMNNEGIYKWYSLM